MKYFFIEKSQRADTGHHFLHNAVCSFLPEAENLYPLGMHMCFRDAEEKARKLYSPVTACPVCCG